MFDDFKRLFSRDPLKHRFCGNPWTYAEIVGGGGVHICCPVFTGGKQVGNIFENTPEEIWNSYQAQLFRETILDGTYSQCDREKCPYIYGGALPTRKEVSSSWLAADLVPAIKEKRTVLSHGPRVVKLAYDASCNLWCPSCRSELMLAKKPEQDRLRKVRDEFIIPFLKDARVLTLSGDGDPFGSNHYREIMKLSHEQLPKLKIALHTNGVLLDQRAWDDCKLDGRVGNIHISVDATTAETYNYTRRGGDFARLMTNLEWLAAKFRTRGFGSYHLIFVVQTQNFREMPDFIRLGRRLGVNSVLFSPIDHWARGMSDAEYRHQKIWGPEHPLNSEFLTMLEDPIFDDPIVDMSSRPLFLANRQPPEVKVGATGGFVTPTPY